MKCKKCRVDLSYNVGGDIWYCIRCGWSPKFKDKLTIVKKPAGKLT